MMGAAELDLDFGAGANCTVRILRASMVRDEKYFESALVFRLPDDIAGFVRDLRSRHPRPAPPEEQLEPHITVLYLGVMQGDMLRHVMKELEAHPLTMTTGVAISGFGLFESMSRGRNWHLTVTPIQPLAAIRDWLADLCGAVGWHAAGSSFGRTFTPHITIWDDFSGSVPDGDPSTIPPRQFELKGLTHIGREREGAVYV